MGKTIANISESSLVSSYESSPLDYIKLMKPRVMSLVVFTAFCGMYLAPGKIHPVIALVSILCITVGAGSAAAINMWYDRDIDAIMTRTKRRPIVTGAIEPEEALAFGVITAFGSIVLMALCVNFISALLLSITIIYYIFIYTIWLKRSSIQNVVIGGVAGAIPPMIGWASVSNDISLESFSLFAIIFMWTPPHSWALALFRNQDYCDCNVPMMPVVKGELYTKKQILFYSILTVATTFLPYVLGIASNIYAIIAAVSGLVFLYYSYNLLVDSDVRASKRLFLFSILYLFLIFLSLLLS